VLRERRISEPKIIEVPEHPTVTDPASSPEPASAPDPTAVIKSRSYLLLLALGALIGVPVATVAYLFLDAVAKLQTEIFTNLPKDLGFQGEPLWWPLPWLALSGVLVALAIRYLPGTGGHEPSEGFKSGGPVQPVELFGIVAAAFATLSLGVVLGPEAPLIALGSGLGVLAVHLAKRDAPPMAAVVIGAAGSFAAIATLLGSPLVGAFLLMEMAGLGGPMMEIVLLPGLLAAGVGSLIFVGLDSLTGFGSFSLQVSSIPHVGSPNGVEFLWAIVIGVAGAAVATGIFRLASLVRPIVVPRRILLTPVIGLAVAGLAIAFEAGTGRGSSEVLFSGQSALPSLVQQAAGWSVGALLLLVLCKGLAYAISLSGFRGGPIFPSMFIGAAGGIALSHLGGLPMIAGVAMGVGAMIAGALKMPFTAVLLPSLLFISDAVTLMPLVIVAVVVSYVVAVWIKPGTPPAPAPAQEPAPAPAGTG
jgi:H+/Cl- antiporter ClcA